MSNESQTFTKPFSGSEQGAYKEAKLRATFGRPKKFREIKGVKFYQHLALLFIGLKLTGYIAWSWWWVLAPLILDNVGRYLGQKCLEYIQRKLGYLPSIDD